MIVIVPYQPTWPGEFAQLAAILRAALGDLALRIDHIGSTAVPGLAAKDIIDIQLTLRSDEDFEPVQSALEALGYSLVEGVTHDHRPPNSAGPDSDWEKRYFRPPTLQRLTHLHVRVADRPNQLYPLLFRDFLRSHPSTALAYAALKQILARYHGGSEDHLPYVEIKDPACDIIMSSAYEWAKEIGWQPGQSDA